MLRFEGPATRRLQRRAAQRTRWELALLALAVGHWAYHKNREWNLAVKDLVVTRDEQSAIDALDDAGPSTTAPSHTIDLTSADEAFPEPVAR
jgi:predicted metalloprotease